jgi:protein-S-isoprenylcysteine O-methyltransferase Ste14
MAPYDSTGESSVQGGFLRDSQIMLLSIKLRRVAPQFGWPALALLALLPHAEGLMRDPLVFRYFFVLGLPIFLLGLGLRLWARGFNRKDGFVLDGPYRYIRNPVELGAVLVFHSGGIFMGVPWWGHLVLFVVAIVYLSFVGLAVDRDLELFYGKSFYRYTQRVWRWIPSRLPGTNRTHRTYSLWYALNFEKKEGLLWILGYVVLYGLKNRI